MAQQSILPRNIDPTKQLVNQEPPVWVQALALLANAPGAGWLGQDLSYINRGYALGQARTARDAAMLGYKTQQGQRNPFQLAATPETVEAKRGPFGLFGTKERAPTDQEKAIIQAGAQIAQAQQIKTMKEGAAYLKSIQGMHDAKVKQLMEFFQRTHDAATVETMAKQMGISDEMAPVIQGLYSRQAEMKKTEEQKAKVAAQEEKKRNLEIRKLETEAGGGLSPKEARTEEDKRRARFAAERKQAFNSRIIDLRNAIKRSEKSAIDMSLSDDERAMHQQFITEAQQEILNLEQQRAEALDVLATTMFEGIEGGKVEVPVPSEKSAKLSLGPQKPKPKSPLEGMTKAQPTPAEPSPGQYFMGEAGKAGRGIQGGLSALYQLLFPEPAGGMTSVPPSPQMMTPVPPGSPGALPSMVPYFQNFGGL